MSGFDWVMWALMFAAWFVVKPVDVVLRIYTIAQGRSLNRAHIIMSTRGEVLCGECGGAWNRDHECSGEVPS